MIKNQNNETEKSFDLIKILPNLITILGLCVGLSAIRYAIEGNMIKSVALLILAGFLDGVDGRVARFLNSTSEFGAQMDSLVDFVNFGVVPAFIIYLWINQFNNIFALDWALVLFFTICTVVRLARFNVEIDKNKDCKLKKYFFKGIPAPCGAALAVFPIILSFQLGESYFVNNPVYIIFYIFILAILIASTVPTFSLKSISISDQHLNTTLVILGVIAVGLVTKPWLTLSLIGIIYLISIPLTVLIYFHIKKKINY